MTDDPLAAPGPAWDGRGTRFRIASAAAERIELCLYDDPEEGDASARFDLERDGDTWSVYLEGVGPGQLYGFRAHGPFAPEDGHLFNPARLLIDPYARAIAGAYRWSPDLCDREPKAPPRRQDRDTAALVPKSVVVDERFDWADDRPPRTPWDRTLIYEVHVKGATRLHPQIPERLRGTYLGLAAEPVIDHLRQLGVSAVQLMPVQHFLDEPHLVEHGLVNYWGYNPIGLFAPHAGYATADRGRQVVEFKRMVQALHGAGIEVLLDVVYNHTAEGDAFGPTLCWRGLDNAATYHLQGDDRSRYLNLTGCGNTLAVARPRVRQMVLDSMRYWVETMHIDGFRFDLAPVLGRDPLEFDPEAAFFEEIRRDPVLSRVKLIAEPWDVGPGGYRLGQFPDGWVEWNDRYRDTVRGFWRGDGGHLAELASRISGSRDLFSGRAPQASVNYIASHDGFTLEDLVSYERKHNEANREANRDGHGHNLSRNWGAEGPTSEAAIRELRERVKRSLLATLAISWGVPMLGHGDELGRSQLGNNNAYCQDGPLTWIDWQLDARQQNFLDFTRRLFTWRQRNTRLWRGDFPGPERLTWLLPDGSEMTDEAWQDPARHRLALWIHPPQPGDIELLVLLNGSGVQHPFQLPAGDPWHLLFDTAKSSGRPARKPSPANESLLQVEGHTLIVLERKG